MTSVSSADALIDCFNQKGFYLFWRPQTAIQHAATDGNPDTVADPNWVSLFPTPGLPRHAVRLQLLHGANDERRQGVLRDRQRRVRRDELGRHAELHPVHAATSTTRSRVASSSASTSGAPTSNGAWLGEKTAQWVTKHEFGRRPLTGARHDPRPAGAAGGR